ncbi:MAG: hypothetical protein IT445_17140 [Phycisphaeraceae bacterium]|nr:hypothetical protein [Phycisphaeraceae bacterium]
MNDRQRFNATMHYQWRDRVPICDLGFWAETINVWKQQGLPGWVSGGYDTTTTDEFFGMDAYIGGPNVNVGLCPPFEHLVIEDRGDHELVQQPDGVQVLRKKYMGSTFHPERHLLVDRASWQKHYKPRLDPDTPSRYPDWDEARRCWQNSDYPRPRVISGGSLYGWLRDWMGCEQISYLVHDDPALFEEVVTTITDCIVEVHQRAFDNGAQIDACAMWEDMCYSGGPLLSPETFRKYLVPQYQRITEQLRRHGCDVVWVDSEGNIEQLIAPWLEAGVNCVFHVEVGTWRQDPVDLRRRYGRDLLMMGGFDKQLLAGGKNRIEAEIQRLAPIVDEGGYIPFCDHRVPPDVTMSNYMFYLHTARDVWAKQVNLKPFGALATSDPVRSPTASDT